MATGYYIFSERERNRGLWIHIPSKHCPRLRTSKSHKWIPQNPHTTKDINPLIATTPNENQKKKALLNSYCYFPFLLLLFFFLKVKPQKQQSSPQKYWILITSSSTYTHILLLEMEFSYKTTITTFLPFSFIFYFLSPTNNPISDQVRPALLSTSTPEVGVFRDSLSLLAVDFAFVVR